MNISDFEVDFGYGLCASSVYDCDGIEEEFVLSQVFEDGVYGVRDVVDLMVSEIQEIETITFRYIVIQKTLELELKTGIRDENVHTCLERDYQIPMKMKTEKKEVAFSLLVGLASLQMKELKE